MKKIISAFLILGMAAIMFGCCATDTDNQSSEGSSASDDSQSSISVQTQIGNDVSSDNTEDDSENDISSVADDNDNNSDDTNDNSSENSDPADDETAQTLAGTWTPYSACNSETDEKASLKTVFGDNFNFGGSITFSSDGTFTSNISGNSVSGSYTLVDDMLTLEYDNGDTSSMKLTGDTDSTSLEQTVTVDNSEYTVYYTM